MRILVVEDEKRLNDNVTKHLTNEGYSVDQTFRGDDAYDYLRGAEYDAMVLDVMLPGMDGFTLLERIRVEQIDVPVLMLTAKTEIRDKVTGLDLGADDYMTKPFSLEELSARLRVLIRRKGGDRADNVLTAGDLKLDMGTKTASMGEDIIKLTAREYQILEYLLFNRGIVLSRDKIEQHIWNYDYEGSSNIIDVYIRNLRKKLQPDPEAESIIETVRGLGYVIR